MTQPPRRTDDPVARLKGTPYPEVKEDYEDFSPLHRLQKLAGALTAGYSIIHGDQDVIVHHNQSERLLSLSALRDKNAQVESMLIPGAGHHWFTLADNNPARRRVDEEPNTTTAPVLLRFLAKL